MVLNTRAGPAVAVDVDGVLAEQVLPVLKKVYPNGEGMTKEEILTWNQALRGTSTNIKDAIESALLEEAFVVGMEPLAGAVAGVQRLVALGYRIIIATARSPQTLAWTEKWLRAHSIPFHELMSTWGRDKGAVPARLMVDDYPGNLQVFARRGGIPVLFDQPWNRLLDDGSLPMLRAKSWPNVVEIAKTKMEG